EQAADQQVEHVLNRLAFGPAPGEAGRVRAMGVDRWIDAQLRPATIPDPEGDALARAYPVLDADPGALVREYRDLQRMRRDSTANRVALQAAAQEARAVVGGMQSARLARAVASERQLQEVMVDFWANHFSVFAGKGLVRLFIPQYERDAIRPHALGKFRDLLGAVAKSPAMLFYLDNWQSMADSAHPNLLSMERPALSRRAMRNQRVAAARRSRGLNENYARELMELHTLGVDGGYTQHDVIEVARALTGWTLDPQQGRYVFRPFMHDAGEKVILGTRFPAGGGEEEGERVLDLLARHPATARFIARKLAVRFVSDTPPPALVARAAATFTRTDGDIAEVVRTIVTSPEFFSRAAYRAKVKTPFELVASALRAMGAAPDTTPRTAAIVARLGQPIWGRQTPDGWPDQGEAWMNTGAILNRINFGLAVAGGRVPEVSIARWPAADSLRRLEPAAQVDGVIRALLGGDASPETRQILLSGENPLASRGGNDMVPAEPMSPPMMRRPQGGRLNPGAAAAAQALSRPVSLAGLPQVVGLALGAPEFQRR
ncbi:MAG TPA: DUF1800 domain-containing protein, partial [Gemmatimonadaceae bacterium]